MLYPVLVKEKELAFIDDGLGCWYEKDLMLKTVTSSLSEIPLLFLSGKFSSLSTQGIGSLF
jgi:hypothetical protein